MEKREKLERRIARAKKAIQRMSLNHPHIRNANIERLNLDSLRRTRARLERLESELLEF